MAENDKIVTRCIADMEFQDSAFPILAREMPEKVHGQRAEHATAPKPLG